MGLHYLSSCFDSAALMSCSPRERSCKLCLGTGAAQLEAPIAAAAGAALHKPKSGFSEVCRLAPTLGPVPCGVGRLCGTALPMAHLLWAVGAALLPVPCAECSSGGQQPTRTFNSGHTAGTMRARAGQERQEPSGRAWDSQDCCAHTPNVHLDLSLVSWSVGGRVSVWEVTQCVRCI